MTEKPRAADPADAGSAPGGTDRDQADGKGAERIVIRDKRRIDATGKLRNDKSEPAEPAEEQSTEVPGPSGPAEQQPVDTPAPAADAGTDEKRADQPAEEESTDTEKIRTAHEKLAQVSQQAGSLLYAQQQQGEQAGPGTAGPGPGAGPEGAAGPGTGAPTGNGNGPDDVVDAEIVEDDKK